ncbi:DUF4956 domain-containing protein [Candidatus Sumerlaeota bacterium]|nr:DUF4956 domain-containing protein [Candidatus Sumerlaeota bacterium]
MFQGISIQLPPPNSITEILINLFLGMVLSFALSWHFVHYGKTLTNRRTLAWILPFIALTTVLVISIVKSSLTLSLGLVGALSIVRFRTPIKEPEELAYLFMAIAIGIGLGANQRFLTVVATILILGLMAIRSAATRKSSNSMFFLNIELPAQKDDNTIFAKIDEIITGSGIKADVRRMDARNDMLMTTYYIDCRNNKELVGLIDELKKQLPESNISFVRQDNLIGL